MSDDLLKRLRDLAFHYYLGRSVIEEAADRIEALQASNLRLSGALYDMTAERDRLKAKIRFLERRALD